MDQARHLQMIDEENLREVALVMTSVGACLRGRLGRTGRQVAVKLIKDSKWIDRMEKVGMSGRVCSEQVLVPVGVCTARSLKGLVWDWMTGGSLHSLLHETSLYPELSVAFCFRILLDVAEGLVHIHKIPLPHGALKATNVLLDHAYRAKLCDWGQEMNLSACNGFGPCYRDLSYLSPEVIQGTTSSVEADIFSFGVLIWETLNRKHPCQGIGELQTKLLFGLGVEVLPLVTPQNQALTQLIIRCLNGEPQRRPSAEECAAVLRTVLAEFHPSTFIEAVFKLKTCKERRLQSCRIHSSCELPIEIHNLQQDNSCKDATKNWTSKVIPHNEPRVSLQVSKETSSLPMRVCPQSRCCRDIIKSSVQSSNSNSDPSFTQTNGRRDVLQRHSPTSLPSPGVSPTTLFQSSPQQTARSPVKCERPVGRSCCRLLQEKREAIIRCMTEGRLNNLLDVLRARQAVSREACESISAELTLSARTRSLLDICTCLGEHAAILVATTLGLVSSVKPQTAQRWQAG